MVAVDLAEMETSRVQFRLIKSIASELGRLEINFRPLVSRGKIVGGVELRRQIFIVSSKFGCLRG